LPWVLVDAPTVVAQSSGGCRVSYTARQGETTVSVEAVDSHVTDRSFERTSLAKYRKAGARRGTAKALTHIRVNASESANGTVLSVEAKAHPVGIARLMPALGFNDTASAEAMSAQTRIACDQMLRRARERLGRA
jgi:hypothetical protein